MKDNYKWLNKIDRIFIYLFVILNSISGLQIKNVSINSILVLLFIVFVLIKFITKKSDNNIFLPKNNLFIFLMFSCILSCVFSLTYTYVIPHNSVVISFIMNAFCYIMIFVLLYNTDKEMFKEMCDVFVKGLIYAARIQVIWGLLQMVFLYTKNININKILFVDILQSSISENWVMGFYSDGRWILRMTGLNYENAIFAIVVCIGLSLEKNKVWKAIETFAVIFCLSRTGWLMVFIYYLTLILKNIKKKKNISSKNFYRAMVVILMLILLTILLYNFNDTIRLQINSIYYRITDNDSNNISGVRHFSYYIYGPYLLINDSNIMQMLFGYGIRCSGIPFSEHLDILNKMGGTVDYKSAWAVESDVIGLLLGGGIVTTLIYYLMGYKLIKNNNIFTNAIIIILFGGVTYHFHSISYIILIFIFASLLNLKEIKEEGLKKVNEESSNINS